MCDIYCNRTLKCNMILHLSKHEKCLNRRENICKARLDEERPRFSVTPPKAIFEHGVKSITDISAEKTSVGF